MIWGDSLEIMEQMPENSVEFVLADPPYGDHDLINTAIRTARRVCSGASVFFMYAEDLYHLFDHPDQIIFWVKPVSTKNTIRRYSRFVEVIACYDLDRSPFNQNTHWSTRTGVFTDALTHKQAHPYEKPQSLVEKLLAVHTKPGYLVLDPFAGSGTVERVSTRMDRDCLSIEIDKKWIA